MTSAACPSVRTWTSSPARCRDYFTVQGWVDFNNGEHGVTIATPENPMVQLGDFHFAHNQSEM